VEGHVTLAHLDLDARRFGSPGKERIRNGPQRGVAGMVCQVFAAFFRSVGLPMLRS
jgi:hypothetical protein